MSLFQNYRLFFGLYSKNIATFWEFEDCHSLKAVAENNEGCNGIYYAACSLQLFMMGLNYYKG